MSALAMIEMPLAGATEALRESLESQLKESLVTSISASPVPLKARAVKVCVSPRLSRAVAGVSSRRVSAAEPKGVPSARVPGEKSRPAASPALACLTKLLAEVASESASGARVSD